MAKISKRLVDATELTGKTKITWDDSLTGFGLRVSAAGAVAYVVRYRTPEGRQRLATIGKHGPLTPDQARAKAKDLLHAIAQGGDPLADRKAAREALTVAQLAGRYLASGRFAEKAPSTQAVDRGRIARHIVPLLGKHRADKLTREDVRRAYAAIRDGKTATTVKTGPRGLAVVKGGEGTARGAVYLLKAILKWGVDEALTTVDLGVTAVQMAASGTRDKILEGGEDYERLFRTLEKMENEQRIRRPVADAIRVIALTGARRGEIVGLRWSMVDLKAGELVIPPAKHKTGRRTGRPRTIALTAAAMAIIASQPEGAPDGLVFLPARGTAPISINKPWRAVRAGAGLPEGIGLHGLRHSLASSAAAQGAEAAELMTLLGHRDLNTTQRYLHTLKPAHAQLAERAAAHITAALEGSKPCDVVPIKGRG